MKQLFLDANILLDFYRFGKDDLDEIKKLLVLIAGGDVKLFANNQLKAEVARNRDKVLSEALKTFKSQNFSVQAPNFCKNFTKLNELNETLRTANKQHDDLIQKISKQIEEGKLQADVIINGIFDRSTNIEVNYDIISRAKQRIDCGNPPGKKGSLGDAIHWECLLASNVAHSVTIVSRDTDFASELDRKKPHKYLLDEWTQEKGSYSSLNIFPSLSDYFKLEFPHIKISDEIKKTNLIDQLEASPNFSTTHDIISELSKFEYFTARQTQRLFTALVNNNQVGWIGTDEDVNNFYKSLQSRSNLVPEEYHERIISLLEVDSDFFFPF